MTPAMILIVLIGAVLAWFLLAGIFKVVGGKTKKVVGRAYKEMTDDDEKEETK